MRFSRSENLSSDRCRHIARLWIVSLFAFLQLAVVAFADSGPLLEPRPDLTPVFKFTQNYNETAEVDPDDSDFHLAVPRGSTSITITASMAGIDPTQFTVATEIEFQLGGAQFSGFLGEGGWLPGKTSANFVIEGIDDLGDPLSIGTVTCTWNATSFTIVATGKTPDAFPIFDAFFPDADVIEFDPNDETKFTGYSIATARFDNVSGERRIYFSGKNTFTQKSFGTGPDREIIDLTALTANGAANYVPPQLSIVSPKTNLKTNNDSVQVQVESAAAESVEIKVGEGEFIPATLAGGIWTATVDLVRGSNAITARATDPDGLQGSATVLVNYAELAALIVSASGNGTTDLNGTTQQELGTILKIKAVPDPGFVFAEWTRILGPTEEVLSTKAELNYLHDTPEAQLRARFVLNPFLPIVGRYTAYSDPSTEGDPATLSVNVTKTGAFTGKLLLNGKKISIKGQLASDGTFVGVAGSQPYGFSFNLPKAALGELDAYLADSTGMAISQLSGNRAVFNAKNPVLGEKIGFYNAILTASAERHGYVNWTLSKTGAIRMSGVLDDGNKFSAGASVDKELHWVFNALLSGRGHLFGSVRSTSEHPFSGIARCRAGRTRFVPEATNRLLSFAGEKFTAPLANTRVLSGFDTSNGKIAFSAGGVDSDPIDGQFGISVQNKLNTAFSGTENPVKVLSINVRSGLFTGKFVHPASGKPLAFSGVFLSESQEGAGLFFGSNFGGHVVLLPAVQPAFVERPSSETLF